MLTPLPAGRSASDRLFAAGLLWLGPFYSLGFGTMASSLMAPGLLALTLGVAFANTLRARPEPL